jgi:sporulation protein YlmC with PRC-barrel domain
MRKLVPTALAFALLGTAAYAQMAVVVLVQTIPPTDVTITRWYKQTVYDPSDAKLGQIEDVLLDADGKATKLIVGVGGFLGIGTKDVAVPFKAVEFKAKNGNKWYPVMNVTKDQLKAAPAFKYERDSGTWVPATS